MSCRSQEVIENTIKTIIQHIKEINKPVLDKFDRQQMRRFIFDDFVKRQLYFLYLSGFHEWNREAVDKVSMGRMLDRIEDILSENVGKTITKELTFDIKFDLYLNFNKMLNIKRESKKCDTWEQFMRIDESRALWRDFFYNNNKFFRLSLPMYGGYLPLCYPYCYTRDYSYDDYMMGMVR